MPTNPFLVSEDPMDYVQGINPYQPSPVESFEATVQNNPFSPPSAPQSAPPEYRPDPRYERALQMLEELATNTSEKRAKEREQKYYGKGAKKFLLSVLEGISKYQGGPGYQLPYERFLREESNADAKKRAALKELTSGMQGLEREQMKQIFTWQQNQIKNLQADRKLQLEYAKAKGRHQLNEAQEAYYDELVKKVGVETAMRKLETDMLEKTGMTRISPGMAEKAALGGINPRDIFNNPEAFSRGAQKYSLLSPGVVSKLFGGQGGGTTVTTRNIPQYQDGQYVGSRPEISTSLRQPANAGTAQKLAATFAEAFGPNSLLGRPQQESSPPPPPRVGAPAPPAPIRRSPDVPSPISDARQPFTYRPPVYEKGMQKYAEEYATLTRQTENLQNLRNAAIDLVNSGRLDRLVGPFQGTKAAEELRQLVSAFDPNNDIAREKSITNFLDRVFQWSGKATTAGEQALFREIVPQMTRNARSFMFGVLRASAGARAAHWRQGLGDPNYVKNFPMQKVIDEAKKLEKIIEKARKEGRQIPREVIERALDPETIFAEDLRVLRQQKRSWE